MNSLCASTAVGRPLTILVTASSSGCFVPIHATANDRTMSYAFPSGNFSTSGLVVSDHPRLVFKSKGCDRSSLIFDLQYEYGSDISKPVDMVLRTREELYRAVIKEGLDAAGRWTETQLVSGDVKYADLNEARISLGEFRFDGATVIPKTDLHLLC